MARRLALAAVGGLLVFAAPAQAGISPEQALPILNQYRARTGLPALTFDSAKNDGCAKHNHWMAANGLAHDEPDGSTNYTPEGDAAGNQSVLAQPEGDPTLWDGSVFHRVGILNPRIIDSGWAASEGFACMHILNQRNGDPSEPFKSYPWPPRGATQVPTRFVDNENPDPHSIVPGELGYLISVNFGGPWFGTAVVGVTQASLKTDAGRSVAITKIDDNSPYTANGYPIGAYLDDAFMIFPHGALKNATTYTVHAAGAVTYQSNSTYPFNLTWKFKTAGQPVPGKASLSFSKPTVKNGKVRFPLDASKSLIGRGAKVFVNDKFRNGITLKDAQTIKVARPAKGKTVRVKVTTTAFTREGVAYPAAKASRGYTRKP
ncbi:MAG TPA: CAP domain-containing protein [Thermoleophilaceae bacterium]|nr:CAP domain-containing protein [Thermoleophilaceae bacterium]